MMKRLVFLFAAFGLLFACTPEENNSGDNNGNDGTVHVTGVSLDRPTVTIKEGESITIVATVTPDNAGNKNVTWSTSSDAVATVDNNGKVTGVKAGSATITATTEDGGKKATCALSVEANLAPSVTVEANHISAISVVLAGKANLGSTVAADLKIGFQYSKSAGILPANSITVEATDADANYNYTTPVTGLDPDTKYYFRSFVRQNGQDTYGETKEFTTKELSSLIHTQDASQISVVSGKLNANIDLTDVLFQTKSVGFYWGRSAESITTKATAQEGEGIVLAEISQLTPSTEYFFQAFIDLDGKELKEEILSFTTKDIESVLSTLDATGIEATIAQLNAKLDLNNVVYSSKSYGFYWGVTEAVLDRIISGDELKDMSYMASLTRLAGSTKYWYRAYVTLDSQTFFGEVKSFETESIDVLSSIDWLAAADSCTYILVENFMGKSTGIWRGEDYWAQAFPWQTLLYSYSRIKDTQCDLAANYRSWFDKWISNDANNTSSDSRRNGFYCQNTGDMAWICLVLIYAYDIWRDLNHLTKAKEIYGYMTETDRIFDNEEGWGLIWRLPKEYDDYGSQRDTRTVGANIPAIIICCELYRITKEQHYLDDAIKLYNFLTKTGNRIRANGAVGNAPLTYTQGGWIESCRLLYHITGDSKYMDASSACVDFTINSGRCTSKYTYPAGNRLAIQEGTIAMILRSEGTDSDQRNFKGGLMPYMINFILDIEMPESIRNAAYDFMRTNAGVLWYNNMDRNNFPQMYANYYFGSTYSGSGSCGMHNCGAALLEGMARVSKTIE